jgi:periplasmic protein TonB
MQSNGYLNAKPRPGMMMAVIAIHAAGIGGLMMIAPTVVDRVTKTLTVEQIDLPVIPPEVIDDPAPKSRAKTVLPVDQIERVVKSKASGGETALTGDPGPLTGAGSGEGLGGDFEIIPIDPPKDPVIVGPRFVGRNAQPPYPPGMQRLNIEGAVTVRVLVGIDGRPVRIEAVKVDQEAFFAATRDWGMRKWVFAPATRDGEPFQEWRTMTVRFEMN